MPFIYIHEHPDQSGDTGCNICCVGVLGSACMMQQKYLLHAGKKEFKSTEHTPQIHKICNRESNRHIRLYCPSSLLISILELHQYFLLQQELKSENIATNCMLLKRKYQQRQQFQSTKRIRYFKRWNMKSVSSTKP